MSVLIYGLNLLQVEHDASSNVIQSHLLFDPVMSSDASAYVCILRNEVNAAITTSFRLTVNNSRSSTYSCDNNYCALRL